jgi:hypothetical protein
MHLAHISSSGKKSHMLRTNGLVDNIELFFTPYSAFIKNGLRNSETVNMLCKLRMFDRCHSICKGKLEKERAI